MTRNYIITYATLENATAGGQKFGLLALKGKDTKTYPPRILSSVFFSWHLADWISEFRLIRTIHIYIYIYMKTYYKGSSL